MLAESNFASNLVVMAAILAVGAGLGFWWCRRQSSK
jgi:cytochrome oxidase assembly protein ShyY1